MLRRSPARRPRSARRVRFAVVVAAIASTLLLGGCGLVQLKPAGERGIVPLKFGKPKFGLPRVHKIVIQQGNVLTEQMTDKLKPGMTRDQVRFVMGEPVLASTFDNSKWIYLYTIEIPDQPVATRELRLLFDGDILASLEGDLAPTVTADGVPIPAEEQDESAAADTDRE